MHALDFSLSWRWVLFREWLEMKTKQIARTENIFCVQRNHFAIHFRLTVELNGCRSFDNSGWNHAIICYRRCHHSLCVNKSATIICELKLCDSSFAFSFSSSIYFRCLRFHFIFFSLLAVVKNKYTKITKSDHLLSSTELFVFNVYQSEHNNSFHSVFSVPIFSWNACNAAIRCSFVLAVIAILQMADWNKNRSDALRLSASVCYSYRCRRRRRRLCCWSNIFFFLFYRIEVCWTALIWYFLYSSCAAVSLS